MSVINIIISDNDDNDTVDIKFIATPRIDIDGELNTAEAVALAMIAAASELGKTEVHTDAD